VKAAAIRVGDVLMLKADNPYGFEGDERTVRVHAIRRKDGYLTPWIYDADGRAFRPSDFARAVTA
jgi:hypothetical protein